MKQKMQIGERLKSQLEVVKNWDIETFSVNGSWLKTYVQPLLNELYEANDPTPVNDAGQSDKQEEPDVIPEVLAEVREYTNLPIILTDTEFPSNHLFCKRGKYCEFTELSKYVEVYVYPTYQKDKQEQTETGGGFTKGEWIVANSGGTVIVHDGIRYKQICLLEKAPLSITKEVEANARLIAAAPAMYEALKGLLADDGFSTELGDGWNERIEAILNNIK